MGAGSQRYLNGVYQKPPCEQWAWEASGENYYLGSLHPIVQAAATFSGHGTADFGIAAVLRIEELTSYAATVLAYLIDSTQPYRELGADYANLYQLLSLHGRRLQSP